MKLKAITSAIEEFAPLGYQESYDNAGLITGNPGMEVTGAVLCLDVNEAILDEAVAKGANLVISHHPIVFHPLKSITGRNYVERIVIQAIQQNIALYAAHTNLDSVSGGMSFIMAEKLGLKNITVLEPRPNDLVKIGVHTPESQVGAVRAAMAEAGAGSVGNYDHCTFNYKGEGTFRAKAGATPYVGTIGELHREAEIRTEAVAPQHLAGAVLAAIRQVHPYEEIAYDVTPLRLPNREVGFGAIGELEEAVEAEVFLKRVKEAFQVGCIRHSRAPGKRVRKIAMCSGSGGNMLNRAIAAGADVFLTGDVKYDTFFGAEGQILLADVGHFESEIGAIELLYDIVRKKFPTFVLHKSEFSRNPIIYL